eukprot:9234147-Pyramimonas_sp.AAC.1
MRTKGSEKGRGRARRKEDDDLHYEWRFSLRHGLRQPLQHRLTISFATGRAINSATHHPLERTYRGHPNGGTHSCELASGANVVEP